MELIVFAVLLLVIFGIIGAAIFAAAVVAMLMAFALAYAIAFGVLYMLIGEQNIGLAIVLAIPLALLAMAGISKLCDQSSEQASGNK